MNNDLRYLHPEKFELIFHISNTKTWLTDGNRTETLHMPTTSERYSEALRNLGITDLADITIRSFECSIPELYADILYDATFSEHNYLAALLGTMTPDDRNKFAAVVSTNSYCDSVLDFINLTVSLDEFEIVNATDAAEYGDRKLAEMAKLSGALVRRLENSSLYDDNRLADFIRMLEEQVDAETYGEALLCGEDGEFTSYGYICTSSDYPLSNEYQSAEDIPQEWQLTVLSTEPPEVTRQTLRAEYCDLSVLLTKFHALAGDYMLELPTNLQRMGPNRDYILAVNEFVCELFPAEWYYHKDSDIQRLLPDIANSEDLLTFIINTGYNKYGHIIGNIAEIPLEKLRESIEKYSFRAISVEVERRDGTEFTFTPQEWAAIGERDREQFNSWVVHYNPDDESLLQYHLSALHFAADEAVSADEFVTRLSVLSQKPIQSEPAKLWLDHRVAKKLTATGEIPVYRLSTTSCELLSPIDTVKPDFIPLTTRGFAINAADVPKFDKWANGEIDRAMRTFINRDRNRGEDCL